MKRLLPLLILCGICFHLQAQTSGERESFEAMKSAAGLYFLNGDYSAAKAQYEGIFKLYGQYEEFTKQVRPDYEKCLKELDNIAAAKKESERLSFSEPFVNFTYTSEKHSVFILAGRGGSGKWEVESSPEWCNLSKDNNQLTLTVDANPNPKLRSGEIIITMTVSGKVISRGLPVLQVARPLEERSVRIITEPAGAQISFGNDPIPRTTPLNITLKEGENPIHIMRQDYYPLDAFIEVHADDDPKITKEYKFELVPVFSLAKLDLKATIGRLDDKNPKLYIGDRLISLEGYYGRSGIRNISTPGTTINRYEIYQNNNQNYVIPLEPATYTVTVTADDFEDYSYTFTAREGETVPLDILMTPKRGTVRFFKGRNAEGVLIKDGSTPIGTLTDQLEIQLTADDHKFYFEKEHFTSDPAFYSIHINPGEAVDLEVNMDPLAYINVTSDPVGAEVIINDVSEGIRTPVVNKAVPLGQNVITIRQSGYYPATITKTFGIIGEKDTLSVKLSQSHPLSIRSDAFRTTSNSGQGFNIYLTSKGGGETHVTEYDKFTDTILEIPYGKYGFEFRRYSLGPEAGYNNGVRLRGIRRKKDLAYKGTFNFKEGQNVLYRMSYSENRSLAILDMNYMLNGPSLPTHEEGVSYNFLGDLGFMKIPFWPGFTSTLLKGMAFKSDSPVAPAPYLFSGSIIFLNGEQRIGGSIHQYADVNLVASYSWLPQLHSLNIAILDGLNVNYINCKDIFFGVEIGSRIPVIDARLKVGYRIMEGSMNFYGASEAKNQYLSVPFDFSGFSASIGISLGDRDAKGAETLRVFFL